MPPTFHHEDYLLLCFLEHLSSYLRVCVYAHQIIGIEIGGVVSLNSDTVLRLTKSTWLA